MKLTIAAVLALATTPAAAQNMAGMTMPDHDMAGMDMAGHTMVAGLGLYAMTREASGTSWQPDASQHEGIHLTSGDWAFMLHATLNGVYDNQEGPRGASKGFASGMVMGVAKRAFASGDVLQLRGMLSPDPLMGPSGYPLLLASGETADGKTPLVDRQHPHDLFMELSASYSYKLSDRDSVFVYGGLPGSQRSDRRRSCNACRSWTRPRRRSATIGSIRRRLPSASSPPGSSSATSSSRRRAITDASPTGIATTSRSARSIRPRCGCRGTRRQRCRCRGRGRARSAPSSLTRTTTRPNIRRARFTRCRWEARAIGRRPRRSDDGSATVPRSTPMSLKARV